MPNHMHGIIQIKNESEIVGVDRCVHPLGYDAQTEDGCKAEVAHSAEGTHSGVPLHTIVQWFKTMSTNAYIKGVINKGWQRFEKRLWQRNYYEHIIRNEKSLASISDYIRNNPSQWNKDKYYASQG